MRILEGLRSFTICGWARPTSLRTGKGGNRIAFNLNYNKAGLDLVHHSDGRLRLAVNQWPDHVKNDSSAGKLKPGQWVFFAVTYNSTSRSAATHWYFGNEKNPATADRATRYNNGPTGKGSGPLTIGNYNPTIHRHGTDRQFRGQLHAVQILGSRTGPGGALKLKALRKLQADPLARPDFRAAPPKAPAPPRPRSSARRSTPFSKPPTEAPRPLAPRSPSPEERHPPGPRQAAAREGMPPRDYLSSASVTFTSNSTFSLSTNPFTPAR
jgi:hypothetical protein